VLGRCRELRAQGLEHARWWAHRRGAAVARDEHAARGGAASGPCMASRNRDGACAVSRRRRVGACCNSLIVALPALMASRPACRARGALGSPAAAATARQPRMAHLWGLCRCGWVPQLASPPAFPGRRERPAEKLLQQPPRQGRGASKQREAEPARETEHQHPRDCCDLQAARVIGGGPRGELSRCSALQSRSSGAQPRASTRAPTRAPTRLVRKPHPASRARALPAATLLHCARGEWRRGPVSGGCPLLQACMKLLHHPRVSQPPRRSRHGEPRQRRALVSGAGP
jgi:hypothetical protein